MKHKKYSLLLIFVALSLQLSCVEHSIVIQVNPGGDLQFNYSGKGDQSDLNDEDFPVPNGSDWLITRDYDPDERNHIYTAEKIFQNSGEFPINFFTADTIYPLSLIKHPLTVEHHNWFFKEVYRINWSFISRGVNQKYPGMASVLHEGESELGWTAEAIEYLFMDCLLRADVGFNREPIIKAELDRWLTESVRSLPDTLIEVNYSSLKTDGLKLLKQSLDPDQFATVDSIFKQLEDESLITLGLIDDRFMVKIILPGELVDTNADTTFVDTLFWEFDVNEFHSADYKMTASSQIIYPARYKWLFGFLLIVVVAIMLWIKKSKAV